MEHMGTLAIKKKMVVDVGEMPQSQAYHLCPDVAMLVEQNRQHFWMCIPNMLGKTW
jgi:hypothetical protein